MISNLICNVCGGRVAYRYGWYWCLKYQVPVSSKYVLYHLEPEEPGSLTVMRT